MKNTKEKLFKYLAVMVATEIMMNVPELETYHEIPKEIQEEVNSATERLTDAIMKVDKYAKRKTKKGN